MSRLESVTSEAGPIETVGWAAVLHLAIGAVFLAVAGLVVAGGRRTPVGHTGTAASVDATASLGAIAVALVSVGLADRYYRLDGDRHATAFGWLSSYLGIIGAALEIAALLGVALGGVVQGQHVVLFLYGLAISVGVVAVESVQSTLTSVRDAG